MTLTSGSLFSGAGGLDLAVHAAFNTEPLWFSEIDPAPSKVLAHHWPEVPNLGDISAIKWENVPRVDILAGGFPCQDVSLVGRRAGIIEGSRSGLWSVFAQAISALHPKLVIIENVRGLLSAKASRPLDLGTIESDVDDTITLRAVGAVLGDLADLGFDAEWGVLPASAVGAPHRRERVFIAAAPAHAGSKPVRQHAGEPLAEKARSQESDRSRDHHREWPARDRRGVEAPVGVETWGKYLPAIERWSQIVGRLAPSPLTKERGRSRLSAPFAEWMMGWPDGWVTSDELGLSHTQQLKIIGNGVCPQQAHEAIKQLTDRIKDGDDD